MVFPDINFSHSNTEKGPFIYLSFEKGGFFKYRTCILMTKNKPIDMSNGMKKGAIPDPHLYQSM